MGSTHFDTPAGLKVALNLLKPIKAKFPDVSFADLMQMASAAAVEAAGGPKIPMRYGRRDAEGPKDCVPNVMHAVVCSACKVVWTTLLPPVCQTCVIL